MSSRRGFLRDISAAALATPTTDLATESVQRHIAVTRSGFE